VDIHFSQIMVPTSNVLSFYLVDEPLDRTALFVEVLVVGDGLRTGTFRWDDGLGACVFNGGTKAVGVVALVSEQVFE
jgi:hypothetical protein